MKTQNAVIIADFSKLVFIFFVWDELLLFQIFIAWCTALLNNPIKVMYCNKDAEKNKVCLPVQPYNFNNISTYTKMKALSV